MSKQEIPIQVRRHPLVATVRKAIGNQNVVVGVSGGADSVALLLLTASVALQESSDVSVVAAHINHTLRKEADEEQMMVEQLCERIGVRCESRRITVSPINGSIAAGARAQRYNALTEIAREINYPCVAVAHHAEDQLETMLMALCRGGGIRKLSGIAEVRPLCKDINLHRPLLHVKKSELISICKDADVLWCDDPTNVDLSTPRGRLRADVIPIIREIWTSADKHAANASTILHAAADVFEESIPNGNTWNRSALAKLPAPLIDAALHLAIGDNATYETIQSISEAVVDKSTQPRTFQCKNGWLATITVKDVVVHHS
ncbi:MAG: tRNA lysidine(34) synthetase TilS [Planctomycetes bacterium]|nr:tRNA lysidine(34) synthetase TilS [Planctomycetota bacterium]